MKKKKHILWHENETVVLVIHLSVISGTIQRYK